MGNSNKKVKYVVKSQETGSAIVRDFMVSNSYHRAAVYAHLANLKYYDTKHWVEEVQE
jgi:hypothetical protein